MNHFPPSHCAIWEGQLRYAGQAAPCLVAQEVSGFVFNWACELCLLGVLLTTKTGQTLGLQCFSAEGVASPFGIHERAGPFVVQH